MDSKRSGAPVKDKATKGLREPVAVSSVRTNHGGRVVVPNGERAKQFFDKLGTSAAV